MDTKRIENCNVIDQHVGSMLRHYRRAYHLSMHDLAARVDLTFQQVQKYEKGLNRISASKLYAFSQILHVPVSAFFPEEIAIKRKDTWQPLLHEFQHVAPPRLAKALQVVLRETVGILREKSTRG